MNLENGKILQIQGSVVDVSFPRGISPLIFEALTVEKKMVLNWYLKLKNCWRIMWHAVLPWTPRMG